MQRRVREEGRKKAAYNCFQQESLMPYQVMCKYGSTYPDTTATDRPRPEGPVHTTKEDAERWMEANHLRTTSNREYYTMYWIVEVD